MIGNEKTKFVVGELTAYRVWKVFQTSENITVNSVYFDLRWLPFTPVKKEQPDWCTSADTDWGECVTTYYGIHAFKSADLIDLHFFSEYGITPNWFFVHGKVKLWGEVIEHEGGYRAEYAQVLSIDGLPTVSKHFPYYTQMLDKAVIRLQEMFNPKGDPNG
jgi:hypothetical protein